MGCRPLAATLLTNLHSVKHTIRIEFMGGDSGGSHYAQGKKKAVKDICKNDPQHNWQKYIGDG